VGTELFGDDGPAHEFGDGEEFEELLFEGYEGIARIRVDAVKQVGLFVVVGGEDNVINYSLENLKNWLLDWFWEEKGRLTACSCSGLFSTDSVSRTWR